MQGNKQPIFNFKLLLIYFNFFNVLSISIHFYTFFIVLNF